jgi:hypothetical protein
VKVSSQVTRTPDNPSTSVQAARASPTTNPGQTTDAQQSAKNDVASPEETGTLRPMEDLGNSNAPVKAPESSVHRSCVL